MPFSANANPYLQATSSPLVIIPLLTLTLPGKPPLRVCDNTVPVVSRGETFEATHFKIVLQNDDSEKPPQVTLEIANIAPEVIEYIRDLAEPPTVKVELVTNADFDFVERQIDFLRLQAVTYDALIISGTLLVDNPLAARFPCESYNPSYFPGLFSMP